MNLSLIRFGTAGPARALAASALLLIPCFWQSRIQAGDLASHVYNVWLIRLVDAGSVEGLRVVPVWTNVLFDLILFELTNLVGSDWAQRLSVSFCVLVFFWGAYFLVTTVTRRRPWFLIPCLSLFSYGYVFHAGLFNFYLSLGICFWALGLVRRGSRVRWVLALFLMPAAVSAHALPVLWTVGVIVYAALWRWFGPLRRLLLLGASLGIVMLLSVSLSVFFLSAWRSHQLLWFSGFDQIAVMGYAYRILFVAMLVGAILLFADSQMQVGPRRLLRRLPVQVFVLNAAGLMLIPTYVLLPVYAASLSLISGRMSLAQAVIACILLARVQLTQRQKVVLSLIVVAFFALLYSDHRELNRLEDQIEKTVRQREAGQRYISGLASPKSRINISHHLLGRACVGHCFDFGNYEPATKHFRLRAREGNAVVEWDAKQAEAMQFGEFRVRDVSVPLFFVEREHEAPGSISVRELEPGEIILSPWAATLPENQ